MPKKSKKTQLADRLIGDLAVANRHMFRLLSGQYRDLPEFTMIMVYNEIDESIQRCLKRIHKEVKSPERKAPQPKVVPIVKDAASMLGQLGGLARAKSLTAERRSEIGKQGAAVRYGKVRDQVRES